MTKAHFHVFFHERLLSLFIVCETMFTIGELRTISHANDTQAQQVAPNPRQGRFSTQTPLERERRHKELCLCCFLVNCNCKLVKTSSIETRSQRHWGYP